MPPGEAARSELILFARAPRPGRVKTRLAVAVGAERAAALHLAFVDDVCRLSRGVAARRTLRTDGPLDDPALLGLARREGMPLVAQGEGDLGVRMARALADALAGGVGRACLIGTDAPVLPQRSIAGAFALLDFRSDVVLGPAEDGGYWLVGARGGAGGIALLARIFAGIAWGGPSVLSETCARLDRAGVRYALADRFWDVDRPEDLARLRTHLREDVEAAPATRAALAALDEAGESGRPGCAIVRPE